MLALQNILLDENYIMMPCIISKKWSWLFLLSFSLLQKQQVVMDFVTKL